MYRDDGQLSAIKLQHNRECKGLIVQIRYLKAKFTRESSLRCNLGYQKQYLLILLTKHENRCVFCDKRCSCSLMHDV